MHVSQLVDAGVVPLDLQMETPGTLPVAVHNRTSPSMQGQLLLIASFQTQVCSEVQVPDVEDAHTGTGYCPLP
jgi:hypothetical protein